MKAFYSDLFVLPLPETHRFPMAKYSRLRERLVAEEILPAHDLHVTDAITWDDLRLVHDPAYIDAIASGTLTREMERRIGFPWSTAMVERSRLGARIVSTDHPRSSGETGSYAITYPVCGSRL